MCGNEISSVSNPGGEFYNMVATQIPTRRVLIKNYPINPSHAIELSSMNLAGVKELRLEKCKINNDAIVEMGSLSMPVLMKLSLNDNELGPTGCRTLANSDLLSKLTELSLDNNKIKDLGLKALSQAQLQFIEDLSLNDNAITAEGIKGLPGKLDSIECLSLGSNKLNDTAVASLNAINPTNIYFLKLSHNEISDDGLKGLIDSNKSLDVLLIDRNKVKGEKGSFKKKDLFLFY